MNILSTSDLFNPVALPSTAHGSAHTHTEPQTLGLHNTHTSAEKLLPQSCLCTRFISWTHMQCIHKVQINTHTHTHMHSGLLCVFVSEGRDCWAHSYVKDAWFRNCFLRWHDCSSVCVCVHMHDRAHEYQVVSFPKNKRHAPSCQMVYLKWWKTCLLIKLRISVLSLILKAEKLPSYMTSWGRLDIYSMLSCDDWDSLAGVGTQEKFGL